MRITISREIPAFKGYWANSDGTITKPNGKTTRGCDHGYFLIRIRYIQYRVSRLIASAFIENPRQDIFPYVDHVDGNPWNNRPENLRYLNHSLNCLSSSSYGCRFKKSHKKWRARVRRKHLGLFKTFLEGFRVARAERERIFCEEYKRLTGIEIKSSREQSKW